jgi:hypothetical protein
VIFRADSAAPHGIMKPAGLFITGALAFGVAQALWSLGHAQGLWRGTWMMKTPGGMTACFVLFVVVGAVACAWRGRGRGVVDSIVALVAGAIAGVAVGIFIVGPGSLWPMVIALDGLIIGAGVALGAAFSPVIRAHTRYAEGS